MPTVYFFVYYGDTTFIVGVPGFDADGYFKIRGIPGLSAGTPIEVWNGAKQTKLADAAYGMNYFVVPAGKIYWKVLQYSGTLTVVADTFVCIDLGKGLTHVWPPPPLSVQPLTVGKSSPITISWSNFQDGNWIYIDVLSGPPGYLSPGESYPYPGARRIGNTSSGSQYTTSPGLAGTYVWQARQEVYVGQPRLDMSGVKSNTITLVVTAAPSSATVTVRGKSTGGYPIPSMLLEIYDKGVKIRSKPIGVVSIGTFYEDSVVVTGAGIHGAQGRMVLTNPLGSYELLTPIKEFTLG